MVVRLGQGKAIRGSAGKPLPTVWKNLDNIGVRFRKGQLVLIAAAPGVGKSVFTLAYCLLSGSRTLYVSADTDSFDQESRATALLAGIDLGTAKQEVLAGVYRPEFLDADIFFDYKPQPTLDDIEQNLDALYQAYLWEPDIIVIDNITNVISGFAGNDEDPFGGQESFLDWLNALARDTGACIIGLHHVTGPHNDADHPVPLSGIKGQLGRVPQMVLTLSKRPAVGDFAPEAMVVAHVKNREGGADAGASITADLAFRGDKMELQDY